MPNYCHNRLIVKAPSEFRMQEYMKVNGKLFFEEIHPVPRSMEIHSKIIGLLHGGNKVFFLCRKWITLCVQLVDKVFHWYNTRTHEYKNTYNWCIENWGTKWTASDIQLLDVYDDIEGHWDFMTAWSPAMGIVDKLSEQYPDFTFSLTYFEPGFCFSGHYVACNGNVIGDDQYDYGEEHTLIAELFGYEEEDCDDDKLEVPLSNMDEGF